MKTLGTVIVVLTAAYAAFAAEGYKVLSKIKIGGTGGWDYAAVDPSAHRLYATHGTIVEVVDTDAGKVVGQITQLHGVHGVAIDSELGKGFISNGQSNSVTIFDLKTKAHLHLQRTVQRFDGH
jgi:DNA-binding beta-propeller fold protein YncE